MENYKCVFVAICLCLAVGLVETRPAVHLDHPPTASEALAAIGATTGRPEPGVGAPTTTITITITTATTATTTEQRRFSEEKEDETQTPDPEPASSGLPWALALVAIIALIFAIVR